MTDRRGGRPLPAMRQVRRAPLHSDVAVLERMAGDLGERFAGFFAEQTPS